MEIAFFIPIANVAGISKESFKHGNLNVCYRMDSKVIFDKWIPAKISNIFSALALSSSLFAVLLIYAQMGFFLWRARNRPIGQDGQNVRAENHKVRALKLTIAIVVTFYICFFPFMVTELMRNFPALSNNHAYLDPTWYVIAHLLPMFNSSSNPVLYALVSKNFRAAYKDIFRRTRTILSSFCQNDANENLDQTNSPRPNYGSIL